MSVKVMRINELHEIGTDMLRHVAKICEEEKIYYCMFFGSLIGTVRHHGPIPWDYDIDILVRENEYARFIEVMQRRLPQKYWVDFRSEYDTPKCFARIGLRGYDTRSLHIDVYRLIGFPDDSKKWKSLVKRGRLLLEMRLVKNANLEFYSGKKKKKIQLYRKVLLPISTESIVKRFDALCKKYPYEQMNKIGLNVCHSGTTNIYDKPMLEDTVLMDYEDFKVRVPLEYDAILRRVYGDYMTPPDTQTIEPILNTDYRLYTLDM